MNLPEELQRLKEFHGHLGPWVVVGYRMGLIAQRMFDGKRWAVVYTGGERPLSCLIDGVQFSSGCTLGKGNIQVKDEKKPMVRFFDHKKIVEVKLKDLWKDKIESEMSRETEEALSLQVYEAPDEELFRIVKGKTPIEGRIVKL